MSIKHDRELADELRAWLEELAKLLQDGDTLPEPDEDGNTEYDLPNDTAVDERAEAINAARHFVTALRGRRIVIVD